MFRFLLVLFLMAPAWADLGTLQNLVDKGQVQCALTGDNSTTSHSKLALTNRTDHPIRVNIPAGQVFIPQDTAKNQYMMTTAPETVEVAPGATSLVEALPTACISGKSVPPPGPASVYTPGEYPDAGLKQAFTNCVSIAQAKEKAGDFGSVPIPEERRASTVSQLSIWMMQADITKKPQDQVNQETIAADFLKAAGTTREALSPPQQAKFDDNVAKIFEAADVTRKQAQANSAINIDNNPQNSGGQTTPREPTTRKGDHGEEIVEEYHPDGSLAKRTTTHPPTPGGDPRDPTSETHKTEMAEYHPGEKQAFRRTTVEEVRTLQGLDAEKYPKKRTTTTQEYERSGGRRYKKSETEQVETLDAIEDGVPEMSRVTRTRTFSGPDDRTGTVQPERAERFDNRKMQWVPR